ncbi:hypothetical protein WR25_02849 isoform A [Diploscapter pachys]|uniref:Protein PRRC1 n=2 Tax=Diploscapter pachys TaxID=2018661 RepID=A0A2A2KQE5_9BILA|nr:hypothetical protein WR25_02849 isoform A [Diploscapter pachys]
MSTSGPPTTTGLGFVPPRPPVLNPDISALLNRPSGVSPAGSSPNPFAPKASANAGQLPTVPTPPTIPPRRSPSPLPKPAQLPLKPPEPPKINTSADLGVRKEEEVSLASPPMPVAESLQSPATIAPSSNEDKAAKSISKMSVSNKQDQPPVSQNEASNQAQTQGGDSRVDMSGGLMSWLTKTVTESKILSDVAEKAKLGMESVLTTLDPGMKGFLSDGGVIDLNIVHEDAALLPLANECFEKSVGCTVARLVPAPQAEFPPTVMSLEQAVTFSLARAERALQSKLIPIGAPLLVFQQFIQKVGERYFTGAHVLLRWKSATIDSIGQMVEIDRNIVEHMKTRSIPDNCAPGELSLSISSAIRELGLSSPDPFLSTHSLYRFAFEHIAARFAVLSAPIITTPTGGSQSNSAMK